ncbi:HAD family hydrolase [Saccharopolyspora halophila]|uniref:HAD family hydrolase n=1 Tax=Saccharopolyspora halophila TaxID=405551 RepID=A0ABN3G8J6_9PSEU
MTSPSEFLERYGVVLLGFDGPICAAFSGSSDREFFLELQALFPERLPERLRAGPDPFAVLEHALQHDGLVERVEQKLRQLEIRAVSRASPTPAAAELLRALHGRGVRAAVVSNLSEHAVQAYLHARGLAGSVAAVSARTSSQLAELKPAPFLLQQAMNQLGAAAEECVMIGDSAADLEAARHAGTAIIAYGAEPSERERFEPHQPDAIIGSMAELVTTAP